jgi:hypothetical protein
MVKPGANDGVYKSVLEQAENVKKYHQLGTTDAVF